MLSESSALHDAITAEFASEDNPPNVREILPPEVENGNDDDLPKTLEQIVGETVRKKEYHAHAIGGERKPGTSLEYSAH